ncbi:MAG TPA: DUF1992 domain-containing protein [Pyrinomonadaceae bacterium]|nr:DUF1992 domain-containing protein [Pyrinomonadaceae bacterium]
MTLKSVEEQIQRAMAEGEFDNLKGRGRPVDLEAYFQTPEHLRMGYSMLKQGEFVPAEVEMLREIESLRAQLASCADDARRAALQKEIRDKTLAFRMMVESLKRR